MNFYAQGDLNYFQSKQANSKYQALKCTALIRYFAGSLQYFPESSLQIIARGKIYPEFCLIFGAFSPVTGEWFLRDKNMCKTPDSPMIVIIRSVFFYFDARCFRWEWKDPVLIFEHMCTNHTQNFLVLLDFPVFFFYF